MSVTNKKNTIFLKDVLESIVIHPYNVPNYQEVIKDKRLFFESNNPHLEVFLRKKEDYEVFFQYRLEGEHTYRNTSECSHLYLLTWKVYRIIPDEEMNASSTTIQHQTLKESAWHTTSSQRVTPQVSTATTPIAWTDLDIRWIS